MRRCAPKLGSCTAGLLLLGALGACSSWSATGHPSREAGGLLLHESFLKDLGTAADPTNPEAVWKHVFERLPDRLAVLPSGGHYYFRFPLAGREFQGNLYVGQELLRRHQIGFSYEEILQQPRGLEPGLVYELTLPQDLPGTVVTVRGDSGIDLCLQRRCVRVERPDTPAADLKLGPSERLLLHSFDESGLSFALMIDDSCHRFAWILNDQQPVPDQLMDIGKDLSLGRRTGFLFLEDGSGRRILVGVRRANELANSWYDGPFDQIDERQIQQHGLDFDRLLREAGLAVPEPFDRGSPIPVDARQTFAIDPYLSYQTIGEALRELSGVEIRNLCDLDHALAGPTAAGL